jgi:chromatin segregation and condensation protein Rec8/ScpA/Scc1 (kleisin family)
MIGVFLALLELIREKKILVHQPDVHGEMEIEPAPEEHRRQYAHASLHLADETPDEELPQPSQARAEETTEPTENTE